MAGAGMAGAGTGAAGVVRIQRSLEFLSGSFLTEHGLNPLGLDIDVAAPRSQELVAALARDNPFPFERFAGGNITLADLNAKIGTGARLGPANAEVSFGPDALIGVFSEAKALHEALEVSGNVAAALPGAPAAGSAYVVVKLGYDARAAANGSVALGAGLAAKFGADASRQAGYAIVRRIPKQSGSRTALTGAFQSWMLPSQFRSLDKLQPGTWLISEVDGGFRASIGAQIGYDLNWIRKTALGELKGNIGLKVQLAASASVGFHASGRYVIVLGREAEDARVRLAVLKERKKGWDFALNAGAAVQAQLPDAVRKKSLLEFASAIAGTNGAQLIEDLKAVRDWTDPKSKLADKLSGFLIDFGKKQIGAAGIDPRELIAKTVAPVKEFLAQWDKLPHEAATALWSAAGEVAGDSARLEAFRSWLDALATGGDLRTAIGKELARVEFLRTPQGRFLESIAVPGVLGLLNNNEQLKQVREAASIARDILNGKFLQRLQEFAAESLNLSSLEAITDPAKLDGWLQAKLSDLLDKPLDAAGLNEARAAIRTILDKGEEIWAAAVAAATKKYNFSLAAGYQHTTKRGALIDMEVDLSGGDPGAMALIRAAIEGDFERVLLEANDRVRLHEGELTHGVKRQSWVEVTLPFSQSKTEHINESLAKLRATDDGSRVLVYQLESTDQVKELTKGKSARDSRLAVGLRLAAEAGGAVRRFSDGSFTYAYSLRQANRQLRKSQARMQIGSYAQTYFPSAFGGPGKETLETWLDDLDRVVDEVEHNGSNQLGNTLLDLEVSLPGSVVAAWFQAPEDKKAAVYLEMSRRIQQKLKDLVSSYYLQDPDVYRRDLLAIRPLLVYASMPPSTAIAMKSDGVTLESINAANDIYWDVFDAAKIRAMARGGRTRVNLEARMRQAAAALREIPQLSGEADFYEPSNANVAAVIESALKPGSAADVRPAQLGSLLRFESLVVNGARKAGLEVAAFRKAAGRKELTKAVQALEEFGAKLTATFHNDIAPIYGGGAVRALGTMVFIEAALALAGPAAAIKPSAMMTLAVYPSSWAGFNPESLIAGGMPAGAPPPVVEERLVSLD